MWFITHGIVSIITLPFIPMISLIGETNPIYKNTYQEWKSFAFGNKPFGGLDEPFAPKK